MELPGELGQAHRLPGVLSLSWGVPRALGPLPSPLCPLDANECSWSGRPVSCHKLDQCFGGGKGSPRVSWAIPASLRDEDLGLLRGAVLLAFLLCRRKSCCWGFVIACLLPVLTKPCREKGIWRGLKYLILAWLLSLLDVSSSSCVEETAAHEERWSKELAKKEQKNLIFCKAYKRKTEEF